MCKTSAAKKQQFYRSHAQQLKGLSIRYIYNRNVLRNICVAKEGYDVTVSSIWNTPFNILFQSKIYFPKKNERSILKVFAMLDQVKRQHLI